MARWMTVTAVWTWAAACSGIVDAKGRNRKGVGDQHGARDGHGFPFAGRARG
jgi:hypothetical protein